MSFCIYLLVSCKRQCVVECEMDWILFLRMVKHENAKVSAWFMEVKNRSLSTAKERMVVNVDLNQMHRICSISLIILLDAFLLETINQY